jgi:hypothetical protein
MARSAASAGVRGSSTRNAIATKTCSSAAIPAAIGDMRLNFE